MKAKAAISYIVAYAMWIVSMMLTVLFPLMGRTSFTFAIGSLLTDSPFGVSQWAIAIDRIFTILVGSGLVANMVIVENYFRTAVQTKRPSQAHGARVWYSNIALISRRGNAAVDDRQNFGFLEPDNLPRFPALRWHFPAGFFVQSTPTQASNS